MSYYKSTSSRSRRSRSESPGSDDEIQFDTKAKIGDTFEFDRSDGGWLGGVIRVMNRLYDVWSLVKPEGQSEIKLPQIVVCGSQSSGKTSVLESISGEEFLPRGTDIQTRCPIVLQLINVKQKIKWVEFLHGKGKRYTNMEDVKAMIRKVNAKIVESKQVVSEDSITLKLFSPTVPNITLVDLPGLVENPMDGQPEDLADKIADLVYKYISNENCIILAITAATNDIADSKAIRLSREVDPRGKRTLGVLTKLDLMDDGTNANDILLGHKIKLDLGIVGVVNRNYLEVQEKKSFLEQLSKEKNFLETYYPALASTNGTPYLIKRIKGLLLKSIHETLPGVKDKLEDAIENIQQELEDIGLPEERENQCTILLRLLTKFAESYCAQVDGRRRNLELTTLNASARIKKLFDTYLGEEFEKLVAATKLSDKEIDTAIQNSHGLHSRHIDYDDAFQELAKREIKKLSPFVQNCTKEVCKEMRNAIDSSFEAQTKYQYPKLFQKIKQVALELISERFKDCQAYLEDYLNAEASIARTIKGGFRDKGGNYQEDRFDDSSSVSSLTEETGSMMDEEVKRSFKKEERGKKGKGMVADDESYDSTAFEGAAIHRANVKKDVMQYFDEAKRQIMEHVARGIVFKLVYGTSNKMTEYLLLRLHNRENAEELIVDRDEEDTMARRKLLEEQLRIFEISKNDIEMILSNKDEF